MNAIPKATGKFAYLAERADRTMRLFNDINNARAWAGWARRLCLESPAAYRRVDKGAAMSARTNSDPLNALGLAQALRDCASQLDQVLNGQSLPD